MVKSLRELELIANIYLKYDVHQELLTMFRVIDMAGPYRNFASVVFNANECNYEIERKDRRMRLFMETEQEVAMEKHNYKCSRNTELNKLAGEIIDRFIKKTANDVL